MPAIGETDSINYYEDSPANIIDIIDNDWDPDNDPIQIDDAWSNHAFISLEDNQIGYTPINDWCGIDTVTYIVCDIFSACDTALVYVNVECNIDLIIPEAFSPDGDGINDFFEIIGLEAYLENDISIFNRWGHKVYGSKNYQNDWDGKSHSNFDLGNKLLPVGTYFYVIDLYAKKLKLSMVLSI